MDTGQPRRILLLCNRPVRGAEASNVIDHIDAFGRYSRHRVIVLPLLGELPGGLDLHGFDAVVIHYTVALGYLSEHYLGRAARQRLREFQGLKVAFVQDEYRSVNSVIDSLHSLGVDLLFTCAPGSQIDRIYPPDRLPSVTKRLTLPGFVDARLVARRVAPLSGRPIDVGYRARKPPYWLGALGVEKWRIADGFAQGVAGSGLKLDLSYREADRLYGEAWTRFVASCKSVLGVEGGASIVDFDGTLKQRVDAYMAAHPNASYEEVHERLLQPFEGRIRYNGISSRCFEAAALRTAMVLFEGDYSGLLQPWRHYIPLRRDFANCSMVIEALRDVDRLQAMVDCVYHEIACDEKFSYEAFIGEFDAAIETEFAARGLHSVTTPSTRFTYALQIARSPSYVAHRVYSRSLQWLLLATPLRRLMFGIWDVVPVRARRAVRPLLRLIGR